MAACRSRLLGKISFHTRDTAIVLCVALVSVVVCRGATQQPETGNDTETELVKRGVTCSWSQSQSKQRSSTAHVAPQPCTFLLSRVAL